jgi:transcription antitermination factor NusG
MHHYFRTYSTTAYVRRSSLFLLSTERNKKAKARGTRSRLEARSLDLDPRLRLVIAKMSSIKYSIGDAVKIISGKYRGNSGVVSGTTEKMYYIRLNTSQVVVRLMASSVLKVEENVNVEVAERIAVELHLMRRSMEALVELLSKFRLKIKIS